MVWNAAQKKVKPEWTAEGKVLNMCSSVEYEAMNIGGSGGKSGWAEVAGSSTASAGR